MNRRIKRAVARAKYSHDWSKVRYLLADMIRRRKNNAEIMDKEPLMKKQKVKFQFPIGESTPGEVCIPNANCTLFMERPKISCRMCFDLTAMSGTKLCDSCYELETRIFRRPGIARKILDLMDIDPKTLEEMQQTIADLRESLAQKASEIAGSQAFVRLYQEQSQELTKANETIKALVRLGVRQGIIIDELDFVCPKEISVYLHANRYLPKETSDALKELIKCAIKLLETTKQTK